jgi:hypothetical protein
MENPSDWYLVRNSIRLKHEACKNCLYDNRCEGVWDDYAQGYGLDELKPILNHDD